MRRPLRNFTFLLGLGLTMTGSIYAQNVGIGTATPAMKLSVETAAGVDGVRINNTAANGDPILQYQVNGTSIMTMGVDDSDGDKFKIGTTALTTNTRMTIQTNGNIGIRTTTPGNMLQMTNGGATVGATSMANFENSGVSGVAIAGRNSNNTSGYNAVEGITDYNGTAYIPAGVFGLAIYNGTAQAPTIGVRGATNEWQGTGVRGSRYNGGGPDNGWGGEFYDDVGYTGGLFNMSDQRTKKDIRPLTNAIDIVDDLRPVRYYFDLDKYPDMGLNREEEFGFIAQEVNQVLPNITAEKRLSTNACALSDPNQPLENESELFMTMDYSRLIPVLTQAIKEQQAIIDNMQKEIDDLKSQVGN